MKYYHNKNDAESEKWNTIRSSLIIEHQSKNIAKLKWEMEKQNQISQTNKAKRNGDEGIQKIRLVGSNSKQSLLLLCLTGKKHARNKN